MKYKDFFREFTGDTFNAPQPDFDRYDQYKTTGFDGTTLDVTGYNPEGLPRSDGTDTCEDCIEEAAPCWKGYQQFGMKLKNGREVPNCIPVEEALDEILEYCPTCLMEVLKGQHQEQLGEAEYHGRKVSLGKPMRGDVKKFKVFVRDPSTGNIKKVNFGDKKMRIKKSIPSRRKSFRARHKCSSPGPRTKARYWSCRKW